MRSDYTIKQEITWEIKTSQLYMQICPGLGFVLDTFFGIGMIIKNKLTSVLNKILTLFVVY